MSNNNTPSARPEPPGRSIFSAPATVPTAAGGELREQVARALASEAIGVTLDTDDEWDFYLRPDEQADYHHLADTALAVMRGHDHAEAALRRVEAMRDKPWVEAQALDDAADDLLGAMGTDSDYWDREDVFRWLTDRSARLRRAAIAGNPR